MATEWTLDASIAADIVAILSQADSADSAVQRQLAEAVSRLDSLVDAPCYFCALLLEARGNSVEVRQRAGLLLKARIANVVSKSSPHDATPDAASAEEVAVLQYVKRHILKGICDPAKPIRDTVGSVLATIVACQGLDKFPDLLPCLTQLLDHPDQDIVKGAFSALLKVLEDELDNSETFYEVVVSPRKAASSPAGQTVNTHDFCCKTLIPKLLRLAEDPAAPLYKRLDSLQCLNVFARAHCFAGGGRFEQFYEPYWSCLGILALLKAHETRIHVVKGLAAVASGSLDILTQRLDAFLLGFMLECLEVPNPYELRFEVVELWSTLLRDTGSRLKFFETLPRLLPLLVENARYCEWDFLQMDPGHLSEEDNSQQPDQAKDLKPRFHNTTRSDDEDAEEESAEKGAWGLTWTLRKGSAHLIDALSTTFGDEILRFVLPTIEQRLQSPQWDVRESAVLVLGAIGKGCMDGLKPFLPKVIEVLLTMCEDKKPVLRSISLWTISRFGSWISRRPETLKVVAATMLARTQDKNKNVQESACSAFAALEEEAAEQLLPYLPDIINTFGAAMTTYQMKNMLVLCDAIATLSSSVGPAVESPLFIEKIVEPLLALWTTVDQNSPLLIVAFECLSSVCQSIPTNLPRYAPGIVERCLEFMRDALTEMELYYAEKPNQKPADDKPRRELLECSMDLLTSICDTLQHQMAPAICRTDLIDLLDKCCQMDSAAVGATAIQTAFALTGDLAKYTPSLVAQKLDSLMKSLIKNIWPGPRYACNNAAWAVGQIAKFVAADEPSSGSPVPPPLPAQSFAPFVSPTCAKLRQVISAPYVATVTLSRNACITFGIVGLTCPTVAAEELTPVFSMWCNIIADAPNDAEKAEALGGLCKMVSVKSELAVAHTSVLLDAVCSLYHSKADPIARSPPPPPGRLTASSNTLLLQILKWLQSAHTAEWNQALVCARPETLEVVRSLLACP